MSELALIAQWSLAAMFVVSAVAKLLDPSGTADAVLELGVPERLRRVATLVPLVELVLAVLFVIPATARWASFAGISLLAIFSAVIVLNLARGRRPDCNCFGGLSAAPISGRTLVRNGVLVGFAVASAHPAAATPGEVIDRLSVPGFLGIIAAVVAAVALTGLGWLVLELWRQQARLLLRIDALEAEARNGASVPHDHHGRSAADAPVGRPAPDVSGRDLTGAPISLSDHWSAGRTTLVVFGDPHCHACTTLEPALTEWQREVPEERRTVVVSHSVDMPLPGGAALFVEEGRVASAAYGVRGTPSALLVDGHGRIASPLAEGSDAIRALLAEPLRTVDAAVDAMIHDDRGDDRGTVAPIRFRPRPARAGQELTDPDSLSALAALDDVDTDVLLVFWNEHCTHCRAMTDVLRKRVRRLPVEQIRVVFVVPSADQATAVVGRIPGAETLIDADMRTNLGLGVPGTPSAALVDRDRRLVVDLAVGPEAVLAVFDQATIVEAARRGARTVTT